VLESRLAPETSGVVYYLPRSLAEITTQREKGKKPTFTFREEAIADLNQRYVLNYQGNALFKDRLCVLVSNGHLQSIEYASEDATPRIAVALAELAAKTRPGPAEGAGAGEETDPVERVGEDVAPFSITFDPFDDLDRARAGGVIAGRLGADKRTTYSIDLPDAAALRLAKRARRNTCDGKGVCFRTKIKTMVRVLRNGEAIHVETLDVVGPLVGNIDLDRVFLVEKVARLGFTDGALTTVIVKRPSQALQAAKLPLDVLDVLLAVPTNFIGNLTGAKTAQDQYVESLQSRTAALQQITASLNAIGQRTVADGNAAANSLFQLSCDGSVRPSAGGGGGGGDPS
jgi:hypothetical protein